MATPGPLAPDLSTVLRTALVGYDPVAGFLPSYNNDTTIFTRRPVPPDAPFPQIVVNPIRSRMDIGGLRDERTKTMFDVAVYGQNNTPAQYRTVEQIAFSIFDLFHRNPKSITLDPTAAAGWSVVNVWCTGPHAGPTDDDMTVARLIELAVEMVAKVVP
jgi:hypothetical protein